MPRMITVLEDNVRYRDGKKWKRRNCFLSKPDTKKKTVTMFITKQFGANMSAQDFDEKSWRQYLVDEITGFEHGRHVDKESHVMALIGCNVVYCIGFDHPETMFRWAETLSKLLQTVSFHVTLKQVSDISVLFNKIPVGTQGNLHVQQNRLCLIGEPADGNKFICEWSMANLISVEINSTSCDKIKKLKIKSNGKVNKGKGHFEFEINLIQISVFESTFRIFLNACKNRNPEFQTNFPLKSGSDELSEDAMYNYSIMCPDNDGGNCDYSSSLDKRSSEIPIPRSREHSGPDQRPIEHMQIKMRKSYNNIEKVKKEIQKHYSVIETTAKHDHDACLFPDDEEIEEQVRHKSQHLLCRGLSQESSGVFVNGPADSMLERDISARLSDQNDSGCGIFASNALQSTSSTHRDIEHNLLSLHHPAASPLPSQVQAQPQLQQSSLPINKSNPKSDTLLTFYHNLYRNPLSLNNYTTYYRLLKTVSDKRSQSMTRSNSFNCVHLKKMKKLEYCRKYSYTNFPLNVTHEFSDQQCKAWDNRTITSERVEDSFLCMHVEHDVFKDESSTRLLSNRLPFRSIKDFHCSIMGSLQAGTVCFGLFSYHHFLSLFMDAKLALKNSDAKLTAITDANCEYKDLKDKLSRKNKSYSHWLEMMQWHANKCRDPDLMELSILDMNTMLVYEILDCVRCTNSRLCDCIERHDIDTNPTIELNDDKFQSLTEDNEEHISPDYFTDKSLNLSLRPVLYTSCSSPDFRDHLHLQEKVHKLSNTDSTYQNLSLSDAFGTMNHTFPKYTTSLNTPDSSSDNKGSEGNFKRFRRKCSPNVFIPLIKRKTSSTHSTLSEPISRNSSKEHNSYYNISNQRDVYNKKCLSVVLDSNYVNVKQDSKYINISKHSDSVMKHNNSASYLDSSNPSISDDNTPYPEEILDPSRNYGDLNFIQSRMRHIFNLDHHNNLSNFRRSSTSILSQKSLQNFGTGRPISYSKRGCSNISRVHSDACNRTTNFRSTDYINVKTLSASPKARTLPQSLNYVTVMESSGKYPKPLSIYTENDPISATQHPEDCPESAQLSQGISNTSYRRTWLSPQTSPVVDYCQIDFNCTYVLREIDRALYDRAKCRDTASLKNASPDDVDSLTGADMRLISSDNYSLSSGSCRKDNKSQKHNKKSFRRLFSRKC